MTSRLLYIFIYSQNLKISKVAYANGMVISTCKHCRSLHLIADNEGKMDMKQYGKKIEDYLRGKGENIQKMSITPQDLENNYLVDKDGVISLVPKIGGQVLNSFIILFRYFDICLILMFPASC
jgi:hypothetical protein